MFSDAFGLIFHSLNCPASETFMTWPNRLGYAFLILGIVLILSGCASDQGLEAQARENRTWTPNYPPFVRIVSDAQTTCLNIGARMKVNEFILGCSDPFGRVFSGLCLVIIPKDDPGFILEHELLHCKYGLYHN